MEGGAVSAVGRPASVDEAFEQVDFRFLFNLPDEELADPNKLMFHVEQAHWFYEDFLADHFPEIPHYKSLEQFSRQAFSRCETLRPLHKRFDQIYRGFTQYKARIPIYGAVLLNERLNKVLLVQSYFGQSWGFPKGKVNEGEDHAACAAREVREEIGFDISGYVQEREFVEKTTKQGKKFKLFICRGIPEDVNFKPLVRKEISGIKWFKLSELPGYGKDGKNKIAKLTPKVKKKFWGVDLFTPKIYQWVLKQPKSVLLVEDEQEEEAEAVDVDEEDEVETSSKAFQLNMESLLSAIAQYL